MIFGKVMWVGRATVFLVGLAVILALTVGVATTALGANGQSFLLGRFNAATALTKLTGNVNGAAMQVVNSNADANDTALNLSVQAGEAPMTVNSAKKVANLNADRLDDREASSFANATHAHSGSQITSGTVAESRIDSSLTRDGEVMDTVKANDGSGSGVDADTIDGQNSSSFASSSHSHDERYYTEGEVNTALSGKANSSHQHSGADINSGTVEADRIEDGAGSNLNADQLDGKDSSAFGIRTEHNWARAHDCDTPWEVSRTYNECAPVTVTVPDGRTYYASVWSTFSARHSEGFGAFQEVYYCSAGKGSGISTSNPCITPFGIGNDIELDERLSSASSSGESIPLSAGTYTFFTAIAPEKAFGFDYHGVVITKVMIRDAANGL